jgi:hypothetical protein
MVLRSGVLGGGKNGISVLRMRWKRTPWSLSSLLPFHYTRVLCLFSPEDAAARWHFVSRKPALVRPQICQLQDLEHLSLQNFGK